MSFTFVSAQRTQYESYMEAPKKKNLFKDKNKVQ